MRKEKALIALLQGLVDLLADEAAHNSKFSNTMASLLSYPPERKAKPSKAKSSSSKPLPDIHAEWITRGEQEFRLWLRDQPVEVLRAIIHQEDLDSTRRTAKWSEQEKLAAFIADGLSARLSRGAAFMRGRPSDP
jgi:hypothetical protein